MVAFENKYGKFEYIRDKKLVIVSCFPSTGHMTDEEYKQLATKLAEVYEEYKPQIVLVRHQDFNFLITPEIQEWINKNVISKLKEAGTKKVAFIVPQDIFAQVSVEQTVSDRNLPFEKRFFEDEDSAMKWLLE